MAVLPILEYPDPRLRKVAAPVEQFDAKLTSLVGDLFETLHAKGGIGLSAPQVGATQQVLVVDLSGDGAAPEAYVNPQILKRGRWGIVEESCLSLPGVVGNVLRATRVRVRAHDLAGKLVERDVEDMHAVCLQHEIDHLRGKLFIDRLSIVGRLRLRWRGTLVSQEDRPKEHAPST